MKYDIHGVERKLEKVIERLNLDNEVTFENKTKIFEFDQFAVSMGLKAARRLKYMELLRWLSKILAKPFIDATRDDLERVVAVVEKRIDLSEWSKVDRKVTLKRFYKWLKGADEEYPKEVRWIKARIKNDRCKLPEELISEEDIKKLVDAASNPRDKALVECLYESGCRISELVTLQIKNLIFDEYGAILRVTGKTGDRRVRIVSSVPNLASWMNCHPVKSDPEAYVFVRNMKFVRRGLTPQEPLPAKYPIIRQMICSLAKTAGISKRVNPHTFRHSRATALANKLTEAQMKTYFGWVQGSKMAGVYVHLSGRDVDGAILGMYGMQDQKSQEREKFNPVNCSRCNSLNSPGAKFCTKCGCNLNVVVAMEAESEGKKASDMMNRLMNDPEFKELMLKKMFEKG